MEFYCFLKCLCPQRIRNKYTNQLMLVNCGKCAACRTRKSNVLSQKCDLESLSHQQHYFVTLTYAPEYLPLAKLIYNKDTCSFDVCAQDEVLHSFIASEPEDLKMLDELMVKFNLNGYVPFLCKSDLQKFLKRLRKRTDKYEEKIRYFACGEYGPVHFRPHYHLSLWFESEELSQNIREIVREAWPYGRIDVQKSEGKSNRYISQYINSVGSIPRLFQSSQLRPFSVHSKFLGEEVLSSPKEEVYATPTAEFIKRSFPSDGLYTDVFVWRSFTSKFFPKCAEFSQLTDEECYYPYTIYEVAREWTKEAGCYCQATAILDHCKQYGWEHFVPAYDRLIRYILHALDLERKIYEGEQISDYEWVEVFDESKLLQSIYRLLFISKRFVIFCCDSDPNKYMPMIRRIRQFYKDSEYISLAKLYANIEESYEHKLVDEDSIYYVYADTFVADQFQKLKPFQCYRSFSIWKQDISQKHKKQNDLNKRLC